MSRMRRPPVGLMLSLTGVLLFTAALFYLSKRPIAIGAGKGPRATKTASPVKEVKHGPERFVGVVVSRAALDLTPRIEGRLKELSVTVGQEVKANDKIAIIDDDAIKRDLQLAQATLQSARAGASKAEIELHEAQAKSARRNAIASELSKEEVAASKTAERLGGAGLSAANAAVAEQKARIAKLQESLKYTEVRAPFPGKIATAYATLGSQLTTQTPIVRLVQNEALCVRFAVPATYGRDIEIGKKVRFELDTLSAGLPGTIENVAPEVDPGSQMLYVEASLDLSAAARAKIQPGLVARVALSPSGRGEGDDHWREPKAP
jgi:RND family efflux transporter MFP subunit